MSGQEIGTFNLKEDETLRTENGIFAGNEFIVAQNPSTGAYTFYTAGETPGSFTASSLELDSPTEKVVRVNEEYGRMITKDANTYYKYNFTNDGVITKAEAVMTPNPN